MKSLAQEPNLPLKRKAQKLLVRCKILDGKKEKFSCGKQRTMCNNEEIKELELRMQSFFAASEGYVSSIKRDIPHKSCFIFISFEK